MKNFLIGMHGGFDKQKYDRDMRDNFYGVEACCFKDSKDVDILLEHLKNDGKRLAIHYPIIKGRYKYVHPFLLDKEKSEREEAFEAFEREVENAAKLGAFHILTHYPKPALIGRCLDWSSWRTTCDKEFMYSDEYDKVMLEELSHEMFSRLSRMSEDYGMKIVIEHDILDRYIYENKLLERLFEKHNNLKFCVDTGRIHLLSKTDSKFNPYSFIESMAKYIYMVHLWNVKFNNNISGGHYPVLPELKVSDGWADIEGYLNRIFKANRDSLVMFEHRSDLINDEKLQQCYDWVEETQNSFIRTKQKNI